MVPAVRIGRTLMPTTAAELRALEDLLSVAYASMFQTFAAQSAD